MEGVRETFLKMVSRQEAQVGLDQPSPSELLVGIWTETTVGCIVVVWRECLEETQEPTCSCQKILKPQDFLRGYSMRYQGLEPAHHSLSQQELPPSLEPT